MKNFDSLCKIYFSSEEVGDYITVVYKDGSYVGMNDKPFWPLGICMHGEGLNFKSDLSHLGKRKHFSDLPEDCKKVVIRDLS